MGAIAQQKGGETHKLTSRDTPTCYPCASGEGLQALPVPQQNQKHCYSRPPYAKNIVGDLGGDPRQGLVGTIKLQ